MLTILFYHVSSILIIDFLIIAVIAQIFIPTAELGTPAGIPNKEAKTEMKTHSVTVDTKIIKCLI